MKKILVADDEANIRLLLEEVLGEEGYQVTTAATGREALRKILKEEFDLLIFDIKMPEMNGLEVVEKIRELKKNTPVIICSAYKHLQDDYVVGTSGITAYITKPVNLAELKEKVKAALECGNPADGI
ncbi:MAG: response regulator [Candidatus Edwardsbacteria bacterium]|nr:response regulator [Candidatus Edwardsbacteria bacterium]MBU1577123.1 response regulator [Candidatus Edwardsbacteria bacterium]MBU2463799.1 response regulator [Candidatus Edwardsbacteria bacterium]MBU2593781.1 response regulator [Candidatus Edwardsbacteria bacterium]